MTGSSWSAVADCSATAEFLSESSTELTGEARIAHQSVGWVSRTSRLLAADLYGVTHRNTRQHSSVAPAGYAGDPAEAGSPANPPYAVSHARIAHQAKKYSHSA